MAESAPARPTVGLKPTAFEKVLATGAIALFTLVAIALFKGRAALGRIDLQVWAHLATVMLALAVTPVQLLRRHGDRWHRTIGWIWAIAMFATALVSFAVRGLNGPNISVIHIFSAVTVVTVPLLVLAARRHAVARHRRSVRIIVTAALLTAGYFTLLPTRLLGHWLWG